MLHVNAKGTRKQGLSRAGYAWTPEVFQGACGNGWSKYPSCHPCDSCHGYMTPPPSLISAQPLARSYLGWWIGRRMKVDYFFLRARGSLPPPLSAKQIGSSSSRGVHTWPKLSVRIPLKQEGRSTGCYGPWPRHSAQNIFLATQITLHYDTQPMEETLLDATL